MKSSGSHLVVNGNSPEAARLQDLLGGIEAFVLERVEALEAAGEAVPGDLMVVVDLAAPTAAQRIKTLHVHCNEGPNKHLLTIRSGAGVVAGPEAARPAAAAPAAATPSNAASAPPPGARPAPTSPAPPQPAPRGDQPPAKYPYSLWQDEPQVLAGALDATADAVIRVLGPNIDAGPRFISTLGRTAQAIYEAVDACGVAAWRGAIAGHHSRTFRHCMLVPAYAAAFAKRLRLPVRDREMLLVGALLHDAGKAEIPLALLDQAGKLVPADMALMRTHPTRGHRILAESGKIHGDILEVVLHHHEFLDGTGYPDRLSADGISDLVRLTTIADMFTILIDKGPNVPPMPPAEALEYLQSMAGKLDRPLVGAFGAVALAG